MYTNLVDKNIKEYNKIVNIIQSCQDIQHMKCVEKCCLQFLDNCQNRFNTLTKQALKRFWEVDVWEERKRYKEFTELQATEMMNLIKLWRKKYDEYMEEERVKEEEKKMKPKKMKKIIGFNKLLKK